jgi:hypothetical protein
MPLDNMGEWISGACNYKFHKKCFYEFDEAGRSIRCNCRCHRRDRLVAKLSEIHNVHSKDLATLLSASVEDFDPSHPDFENCSQYQAELWQECDLLERNDL